MPLEPRKLGSSPSNPYANRWRWWYSAIADWMIRNPQGHLKDCAAELNKGVTTISMIVNTDMFREYLARRKEEWRANHDFGITSRLSAVAEQSLDLLLDGMKKKGDQIPMKLTNEIANTALERLGYGPKGPSVQINQDNRSVSVAVDANALLEAREALRLAESRRLEDNTQAPLPQLSEQSDGLGEVELEAEPLHGVEEQG